MPQNMALRPLVFMMRYVFVFDELRWQIRQFKLQDDRHAEFRRVRKEASDYVLSRRERKSRLDRLFK